MIDLDEFERRLRRPVATAPQPNEDPLAELARLVGGHEDPFKTVFEQDRRSATRDAKAPAVLHTRTEPSFENNFAAEEFAEEAPQFHGTIDPQSYGGEAASSIDQPGYYPQAQAEVQAEDYAWTGAEPRPAVRPRMEGEASRSRRPLFVMAAIIAIGITGIGASFAYKSKSGPHEIATINAMSGPTKIQPDSPGGVEDVPNQDASILNKNPQQVPTKLADRREAPVDLSAHISTSPRVVMADAGATGTPGSGTPGSVSASAGSQNPVNMAPQDVQSYGIGALIEPKKVKTVSVRSDGTLLPNDTPPQMPQTAPAAPQAPASSATPSATATTPKPATAKSTARVVTTPKPPQSIDQLAADAPLTPPAPVPVKPKAAPPKPVKLAEAETADTAQDAPDTTAHSGGGGFAVQFAAPGSEQEAHEITAKLSQKFGDDLSGHRLTYHRAKVGDKTVYRVRTAGLSREEAAGICEKVKSSGGSCFIAKN
jgi:hypothetical protein